jgi:cytochrome c oxidase cbb3-type subunit III
LRFIRILCVGLVLFLGPSAIVKSQSSPPGTAQQPGGEVAPTPAPPAFNAYPRRPPADPGAVERGKTLFSVNCSFCHGSTAKGGEGGPNLVRSEIVMNDKDGELIATVVQNGRPDRGMPKFDLTAAQVSDIAAFIHSFPVGGRASRGILTNPVVGDAKAGEAFFIGAGKCSTCHSSTGDLAKIGAKNDPRTLQAVFLTGGSWRGGRPGDTPASAFPTTVTVTLSDGRMVEGKLNSIDDFFVSLTDASGNTRTFPQESGVQKVEVHNPRQAHMDMWTTLTDAQVHDITAYLVTLK